MLRSLVCFIPVVIGYCACSASDPVPAGSGTGGATSLAGVGNTAGNAGVAGLSGVAGEAATVGGATGTAGASGTVSDALPPPRQCGNQFYATGCIAGDTSSACGGICSSINACQESEASKPFNQVTFLCPRFMLFSPEMLRAAESDGLPEFNYAVVGHDVDTNGIDGQDQTVCCQCYQLVFDYPEENQANQNASTTGPSAIPIPPPLIVQAFNTGTNGPHDFDIYMGAGGFGANNACDPDGTPQASSGLYSYLTFPNDGEPSQGGVKGAGIYQECKTSINWVTTESLSSAACQTRVAAACNEITATDPAVARTTIDSCTRSNEPNSYYHLNWRVYAKKVECPTHLTEVTGCKLAPQGLPAADRSVTTNTQAAQDPSFLTVAVANGLHFSTTTMQDCCKPTCAWQDKVGGLGLSAQGLYNSFYSCDQAGVPQTE